MQLFTGRAKEITTIPTKKHSTGFKTWMLGDHGYILNWLFHSKGDGKGDGPYKLDPRWKNEGFSATEAVVLHLAMTAVNGISPLTPGKHMVWLDNLFTTIRLLERLRKENIGAAGIVRPSTNKTPREEKAEKKEAVLPPSLDIVAEEQAQSVRPEGTQTPKPKKNTK